MAFPVARQENEFRSFEDASDELFRRSSERGFDLDLADLLESFHLVKAATPDDANDGFAHDLLLCRRQRSLSLSMLKFFPLELPAGCLNVVSSGAADIDL